MLSGLRRLLNSSSVDKEVAAADDKEVGDPTDGIPVGSLARISRARHQLAAQVGALRDQHAALQLRLQQLVLPRRGLRQESLRRTLASLALKLPDDEPRSPKRPPWRRSDSPREERGLRPPASPTRAGTARPSQSSNALWAENSIVVKTDALTKLAERSKQRQAVFAPAGAPGHARPGQLAPSRPPWNVVDGTEPGTLREAASAHRIRRLKAWSIQHQSPAAPAAAPAEAAALDSSLGAAVAASPRRGPRPAWNPAFNETTGEVANRAALKQQAAWGVLADMQLEDLLQRGEPGRPHKQKGAAARSLSTASVARDAPQGAVSAPSVPAAESRRRTEPPNTAQGAENPPVRTQSDGEKAPARSDQGIQWRRPSLGRPRYTVMRNPTLVRGASLASSGSGSGAGGGRPRAASLPALSVLAGAQRSALAELQGGTESQPRTKCIKWRFLGSQKQK
jgi:hypothetical protein